MPHEQNQFLHQHGSSHPEVVMELYETSAITNGNHRYPRIVNRERIPLDADIRSELTTWKDTTAIRTCRKVGTDPNQQPFQISGLRTYA